MGLRDQARRATVPALPPRSIDPTDDAEPEGSDLPLPGSGGDGPARDRRRPDRRRRDRRVRRAADLVLASAGADAERSAVRSARRGAAGDLLPVRPALDRRTGPQGTAADRTQGPSPRRDPVRRSAPL